MKSIRRSKLFDALLIVLGGVSALSCSDQKVPPPAPQAPSPVAPKPPSLQNIELIFPYGSEKEKWLVEVTEAFNRAKNKTTVGHPIVVTLKSMGSGELTEEILSGRLKAHLASPASAAFIKLANAQSRAQTGKDLIGQTENLLLSPVVIATWRPMAEALGWGTKPIGWAEIHKLATNPGGWADYGHPEWGSFKFGHTHPEYSNSGLIALLAEVYAGAGKAAGLNLSDTSRPEVAQYLNAIEGAVVHYGSSTGFFGRKMFVGGPQYLSAAVLYENMVIEAANQQPPPPLPVVAIYPREGTFWSDHPVGVVEREWVTPEHREAARKYIDFLLAEPQQTRAMDFGFRPANIQVKLRAPLDAAHGIDPMEPKTTLEVPSAEVMNATIDLWHKNKKHSHVVLVLDTSGSMQDAQKMQQAKEGAKELIVAMKDEDYFSLLPFSDRPAWAIQNVRMGEQRAAVIKTIDSLFPQGGTALYEAIDEAHRYLLKNPQPDKISAIVALTDGADTGKLLSLDGLLPRVQSDAEHVGIRIFTIGYGQDARQDVLDKIADATAGKSFKGKPETIRAVFKEISTFF